MRWSRFLSRRRGRPPKGSILVESDVGPTAAHAHDAVITPILCDTGSWEPEVAAWLRTHLRPGMTAVDVGANVGYHALVMAEAVGAAGTVVAVEPDPGNLALLRWNDTQATEHHVLRGATSLVQRSRPLCLVEYWPEGLRDLGDDPAAIIDE